MLKRRYAYPLCLIRNADQTMVFFDMLTNVTLNKTDEKSILVQTSRNKKSRITYIYCFQKKNTAKRKITKSIGCEV